MVGLVRHPRRTRDDARRRGPHAPPDHPEAEKPLVVAMKTFQEPLTEETGTPEEIEAARARNRRVEITVAP